MPVALPIDWKAVALAASAGVPYPAIARKHGVLTPDGRPDTNAIRQRAFREKWPVPKRVHESAKRQAREALKAHHELHQSGAAEKLGYEIKPLKPVTEQKPVTMGFSAAQSGEIATVTVTDDLLANGVRGTLAAQKIALRSILDAPDSLPVTSPSDLQSLLKTVRIASGQDKEGTNVNVVVGGNWSDWPEPENGEPVTVDVTAVDLVNWDEF